MAEFDKDYWEHHWAPVPLNNQRHLPVNPYVMTETGHLSAGAALDAGCGIGAEALWLAEQGWQVTAADISSTALASARARAENTDAGERIDWVETDLSPWQPGRMWDLVVTSYAHAQIGQLPLYRRLASWVAPGGTLLIVGHLHDHRHRDHHGHPESASVTLEAITNLLQAPQWQIHAAYEHTRAQRPGGHETQLRDVIVRAQRTA